MKKNIIMCLVCVCIFFYFKVVTFYQVQLFLTSTIILLILIRVVHVREKGGKRERIKKEKDEVCM